MSTPEIVFTGVSEPHPPPPTPAEIQPLFPQLEIVRLIGRGGMGAVYEAKQRGLQRTVALKLLWAPQIPEAGFEERFLREGRALAHLSHDNVVGIHDAGKAGNYYWLLMEYVDGQNLRELLQAGVVDPMHALTIVKQMCAALEYAHKAGVVHRDIKPENVLISKNGRVKIADFGLAKVMSRSRGNFALTGSYQAMGTPHYMAPEQIEHPKDVDHRADIYSLGVVFYEILTGELPLGRFAMPSRTARMDARLDDIVAKALQKEPGRRYQAASEIGSAIELITTPRPRSTRTSAVRTHRSKSGSWLVVAAGFAVMLLAGFGAHRLGLLQDLGAPSEPTTQQLFVDSKALLANPDTFLAGIAGLEQVEALEPETEGLRAELARVRPQGVEKLQRLGRAGEAYAMARRAQLAEPGPANNALVEEAEKQACKEFEKYVQIEMPTAEKPVHTRRVPVSVTVLPERNVLTLKIGDETVTRRNGKYDHVLEFTEDGAKVVPIEVTEAHGFPLTLKRSILVDTQPPVLTVSEPKNGDYVQGTFKVAGTCKDVSHRWIEWDGRKIDVDQNDRWEFEAELGEGQRTLEIVARDAADKTDTSSVKVIVDTTPPVLDLLGKGPDFYASTPTKNIEVKVTDDHKVKHVLLNGAPLPNSAGESVPIPLTFEKASSKPRTYELQAVDMAGNPSERITVTTWFDETPPQIIAYEEKGRAISGRSHKLEVTYKDRCPTILVYKGKSYASTDGEKFEVSIEVPADRGAGQTFEHTFLLRDAAENETTVCQLVLTIADACLTCKGDKNCTVCNGGNEGECGRSGCERGLRKIKCDKCSGSGLSDCTTCEGKGKLSKPCGCDKGRIPCRKCDANQLSKAPCRPCSGTGKVTYASGVDKCIPCNGKKHAYCPDKFQKCEAGCKNGQITEPCPMTCTDGKSGKMCLPCSQTGKEEVECERCDGGRRKQPCKAISCDGGRCKPCSGSGFADGPLKTLTK